MHNQTVVVIDDDVMYLQLIQEVLYEEGYSCVQCILRTEAEATIRREQPSLVLLDLHAPRPAPGWQLLDRLRRNPTTTSIPIIICTTLPRVIQAQVPPLLGEGCDILEKPFQLEELLRKVQAHIGPPQLLETGSTTP